MITVILAVISLLVINGEDNLDRSPLVFQDQGIILTPQGLVSLTTKEIMVSLMIKVKKPKIVKYTDHCDPVCEESTILLHMNGNQCKKPNEKPVTGMLESFTENKKCLYICLKREDCKFALIAKDKCDIYGTSKLVSTTKFEATIDMECVREKLKEEGCSTTHADTFSKLLTEELQNDIDTFWNNSATQFREISDVDEGTGRKKRQAALIIGAAGLLTGILTTSFSFYKNKQISTEVERMKTEFREFTEETHKFEKNVIKYEDEVLKILESQRKRETQAYEKLTCKSDMTMLLIMQSREVQDFKDRVQELTKPLQFGKRSGFFTPNLINVTALKHIIENYRDLKESLYETKPSLLYTTSTMYLGDVKELTDSIAVHILLSIPVIRSDNVYHSYKTSQSGFYHNGKCWKQNIPTSVYVKEPVSINTMPQNFYSLDNIQCTGGSDLFQFCDLNITKTDIASDNIMKAPCLSDSMSQCEMQVVDCSEQAIHSQHGLLTFSNKIIKGVTRRVVDKKNIVTWTPKASKTHTKYWSWDTYRSVQLESGVFQSAEYTGNVSIATLEKQEQWWSILRETDKLVESRNLTEAYQALNMTVSQLDLERTWFKGEPTSLSKDIALTAIISITIFVLTTVIIYKCAKRSGCWKKSQPKRAHTARKRKQEEMQKDHESEEEFVYEDSRLMPEEIELEQMPAASTKREETDEENKTKRRRADVGTVSPEMYMRSMKT